MLIFCTDESSCVVKDRGVHNFSIYGGLLLSESKFRELTNFIYKLKERYVLPQKLELKWRFATVWEDMKKIGHIKPELTKTKDPDLFRSMKEDYDKLKEEILIKISRSKVKIIIVIRPTELLRTTGEKNTEYSINAIVTKIEKILEKKQVFGVMLADELPKRIRCNDNVNYEYILDLCHSGTGLIMLKYLTLIVPTIDSRISPIHQINDIVLGAIQYYVLEFIRKINDPTMNMDVAKNLLEKIVGNFHKSSNDKYIINNGILLYPPKINRQPTRAGIFLDNLEEQLKTDFNIL